MGRVCVCVWWHSSFGVKFPSGIWAFLLSQILGNFINLRICFYTSKLLSTSVTLKFLPLPHKVTKRRPHSETCFSLPSSTSAVQGRSESMSVPWGVWSPVREGTQFWGVDFQNHVLIIWRTKPTCNLQFPLQDKKKNGNQLKIWNFYCMKHNFKCVKSPLFSFRDLAVCQSREEWGFGSQAWHLLFLFPVLSYFSLTCFSKHNETLWWAWAKDKISLWILSFLTHLNLFFLNWYSDSST